MAETLDLTKVEYDDGSLTYDADMDMGALRRLFASSKDGDLTMMMEAYTKIVHTWPYAGDPATLEGWDALKRSQFMRLNAALMGSLSELGEG